MNIHVSPNDQGALRGPIGLIVVLSLHAIVGYAVINGVKGTPAPQEPVKVRVAISEPVAPPPVPAPPPPPRQVVHKRPNPPAVQPPPTPLPAMPPAEVQADAPVPETAIAVVAAPPAPVPQPKVVATAAPSASSNSSSTGPVRVPAVVDSKQCGKPAYPRASIRNEEQGTVFLGFLIGSDGTVLDSKVQKSSGYPELDRAARDGLSLCKFKPATVDGVPERSWMSMQYVWKLQ